MSDEETKELLSSLTSILSSINLRLEAIEKRLSARPAANEIPPPPLQESAKRDISKPQPSTLETPLEKETSQSVGSPPPLEKLPAPTPATPPVRPTPPPPLPPKPDPVSMEKKIGVWLSRIGVVLVFFAAAFFLKIAYDHLGEVGRASIGIMLGVSFLIAGEIMESKKYSPLARALTGGGLMILYLALYATTGYFKLISAPPAFLFMVLVTATGVTLSVRYDSQVIMIMALVGGFLTPALVSTGTDRQVTLMTYMVLLNCSLIGFAYWRKWRGISMLCFVCTSIMFIGWADRFYVDEKFTTTFVFATIFFIIFSIDSILHGLARKEQANLEDLILVTANAIVYFTGMFFLIKDAHLERMLGPLALGISIFYFIQSRATYSLIPDDSNVNRFLTGFAVAFLTLAIPLHLDYESVTLIWAALAAALSCWGLYSKNNIFYYGGLAILGMAVVHLFGADFEIYESHLRAKDHVALIVSILVTFISVLASLGGIVYAHHRFKDRREVSSNIYIGAYIFEVMLFMVFMLALNHYCFKSDFYPSFYSSARRGEVLNISLILGLYSFALVAAGILYGSKWLRYLGLPLLGLTLVKVVIYDLKGLDTSYRVVSFLALGFLLIGLSFLYNKYKDRVEGIALSGPGEQKEEKT